MTPDGQSDVTLNDGRRMPQFGLGVWQTPAGEAAGIVRAAVAAGYRAVDTAAAYKNETGVGEGLAGTDVFLTTKLWNDDQGYDEALRAFDASAGRLGREDVDLYLIHWPAPRKGRFVDSWKALVRLKQEGRARSIGVSNFTEEHIERIVGETGVTPAVNQIELESLFDCWSGAALLCDVPDDRRGALPIRPYRRAPRRIRRPSHSNPKGRALFGARVVVLLDRGSATLIATLLPIIRKELRRSSTPAVKQALIRASSSGRSGPSTSDTASIRNPGARSAAARFSRIPCWPRSRAGTASRRPR